MSRLAEVNLTINFNNGLIGLSMLTGSNSFLTSGIDTTFESAAVRVAKLAFTTPETTPPWKEAPSTDPVSSQIATIKRLKSIIDKSASDEISDLPDIQTAFTSYKALDKLRLLAESAAKKTTSSSERKSLEAAFAKGLADLQTYLGQAPTDKVALSFGLPARTAQSVGMAAGSSNNKTVATGVVTARDAAIPGLTGNEVLKIELTRGSIKDTVTVDLSQGTQPPTLDSVTAQLNAAITSVPMLDVNGDPVTDAGGNVLPRWQTRFAVEKNDGKWGLVMKSAGTEKLALDQVNAGDALMVVSGQTALDAPSTAQILRFDDPTGALDRNIIGSIAAIDRTATEQAQLTAKPSTDKDAAPVQVFAATTARAIATDAQGFSYVVGTTAGDLGANLSDGGNDLFLTKLDSEGKVVWQRTLGVAGEAEGAAVSIAANGDVVVAGTVKGPFNGSLGTDSDMLVAKFDANGDEKFSTSVRQLGNDTANAVTVGADGSVYVGGKSATGGGDAFVARLDTNGKLQERRTIDSGGSDSVAALAIDSSGELLALTRENGVATLRRLDASALSSDLGSIALGSADARAIAVSATGEIAVVGATQAALSGTQVNGLSGGRDGFVTRIDSALSGASTTYIGSADSDEVDSVTFMGGALYIGGRTTGAIGAARVGATDGFVSRIDTATGAIENTSQFGRPTHRTEPVRIAAATGGASVLGALGLRRGTVNVTESTSLTAQTSLRAGDEFSISVAGGRVKKITIAANETLTTLADKIRKITGANAAITTPKINGKATLRINAKEGYAIELIAGVDGKDALAKLGMEPARLSVPTPAGPKDPKVRPGGNFGLALDDALNLNTAASASVALEKIKSALSMTQTAYRSLYWDTGKANLVDGATGNGSAYQQAQLANYQAALDRLTTGS
ncbi:regulatory protein FlaEY [Sphingomonas sp. DBB INV C78]|uniref:hypothetical protein n=1 Tax=Sphingomonas sp. DBB INV C78 TaxID=3349434 RepID=UPI0036D3006D